MLSKMWSHGCLEETLYTFEYLYLFLKGEKNKNENFPYLSTNRVEVVKVTQSCPTLCDPMDYIVHGILQARILEWVAFPLSRGSSQPRDQTQVTRVAGGFLTS